MVARGRGVKSKKNEGRTFGTLAQGEPLPAHRALNRWRKGDKVAGAVVKVRGVTISRQIAIRAKNVQKEEGERTAIKTDGLLLSAAWDGRGVYQL